jgi:hypothetical protein
LGFIFSEIFELREVDEGGGTFILKLKNESPERTYEA